MNVLYVGLYGSIYGEVCTHPLMKLGDEPQLSLQVGAVLLCSDVTQEVLMSHPRSQEYVPFILPRLLVLHQHTQTR